MTNTGNALVIVYTPKPLVAPVWNGSPTYAAGAFNLTFSGPEGQTYQVLASTNLLAPLNEWVPLTNGVFGPAPASFSDPAATNQQEFYRVTSP